MSAIQPITGAVVVAIPAGGKPFVALDGRIFATTAEALVAARDEIAMNPWPQVRRARDAVSYAVATIGLVDGRKA